jgi:quercetin dioxygenase-like cupin family protein
MDTVQSVATQHPHTVAGQGQRWRVMDDVVEARLRGAETDGAYSVFEVASPPGAGPSMLHTHPPQETFYILEGSYEFGGVGPDGAYTLRATAGDVVHIPAGAPHGFKNVGDTPGRLLVIYEPPGKMEAFFAAMHAAVRHADPLNAPPSDLPVPAQIDAIFAAHDMVILPPTQA